MKESAARTLEMVESSLRSRARRYQAEHGPRRGRYPEDFKREIVAVLRSGVDLALLAEKIGIPKETLRNWQSAIPLTTNERPPCRPLHVVDDQESASKDPSHEQATAASCVIRLSRGVEIALPVSGIDERILRVIMGVMP